jgi:tetratricopeptide (TPR) repeat protein
MKRSMVLVMVILSFSVSTAFADMFSDIAEIQHLWAKANYETPEALQEKAFEDLTAKARQVESAYPSKAEPKIWLAIVLSSDAGVNGGLGALSKVKEARKYLEEAEKINPDTLDGSVYTSLGSLYYQVPGWPIGFGNDGKAEQYLKKALAVNPDGIDPNYFYGDFMLEEGKLHEAVKYLEKAQNAPDRKNRPIADKGRRYEIAAKLAKAKEQLN